MKKIYWVIFICYTHSIIAQNDRSSLLFDDKIVSSVYIDLPADSLNYILTNIYSDLCFHARFIFDDGVLRDTLPDIGFRLRGNTSRRAKKKSFKISFNEFQAGRRYQNVKKINLNGSHNDPTMVREKLYYDIWNQTNQTNRRVAFTKLYINGDYFGLYSLLEEYDKDWLKRNFVNNDGNLYKCVYPADLVYLGTNPSSYQTNYELQTNEAANDYSAFIHLLTALNAPINSPNFIPDLKAILNVESCLYAFATDVATGNWDNYFYNKNNYFLYHHLADGQFYFIPYDTDNSIGVDWVNRDWATRDCTDWLNRGQARPLGEKLMAVPAFRTRYYEILDSITRHITAPAAIFPRIDSLKSLVYPAVVNDIYRTLDYGYDLNDFSLGFTSTIDSHTPYGVKPFFSTRYQNTVSQLTTVGRESVHFDNSVQIFPNPSTDIVYIKIAPPNGNSIRGSIIDVMGRKVDEFIGATNDLYSHDVRALPKGVYFIRLEGENYPILKFIKN